MQDFAKSFYLSKEWRAVRDNVFKRDCGLCVRCGKPGEIVHHKTHITPANIDDPNITLNWNNLQLVCRECHAQIHAHDSRRRYKVDDQGHVIGID
jgi:5-methylcytosine-specific restriction endonuclease McrA